MFRSYANSHRARGLFGILCAATVLLGLPGSGRAQDASTARYEISQCKANISKATTEITDRTNRIFAGDLLIIAAELAVAEAKKKENNEGAVFVLELSLAALKVKKNSLITEKQDWERYKRECEKNLSDWEAYLRRIGG
ncbi:hypothetical protein [Zavarzinella formosa]|uniref:hypothetical protein n=1 Tax=Zavarzinella formosa TaxID=360055 RepID=UPI000316C829|nr:hypothetical protein [Zavarzinella formosa]